MKSRQFQALAGFGLALGGSLVVPAVAQAQQNRAPAPGAAQIMVPMFKSTERNLGAQAADALRDKIGEFPAKQAYPTLKENIEANLQASGFSTTEALAAHDARALASLLRADEFIMGSVSKTPTGVRMEASLVLPRDNSLVQPLGVVEAKNVGAAASAIAAELREARKQLAAERQCSNLARDKKYDEAIAAAKEGITAYPKSTLARICIARVMEVQKAPAEAQLAMGREIVNIDPKSRPGLAVLANSYKTMGNKDSASVTFTRLLATDPTNPRLQEDVIRELTGLDNPKLVRPVIDSAVALNPGDPDLLKLRWLILMSTRDFKAAHEQGEELVRLDTAFADTTYFVRTARAYAADSQPQKAAEIAARGLQKFPNDPGLIYEQVYSLRAAGQNQQALEVLDKATAAKVPVENSNVLRLTLLKDLGRGNEMLPAIRAAVAAGDTSTLLRQLALQAGDELRKAAGKSQSIEDYAAASAALLYADSISTGAMKAQAQFLAGTNYLYYGQAKLAAAQAAKSCPMAKEGKGFLVEAQIMLPKGGSFAPDQTRQLMGALMQLDTGADALVKQLCK
ncbi:MAG: hypothetical protein V4617_19690 [Gemmatimonadota bacterium]